MNYPFKPTEANCDVWIWTIQINMTCFCRWLFRGLSVVFQKLRYKHFLILKAAFRHLHWCPHISQNLFLEGLNKVNAPNIFWKFSRQPPGKMSERAHVRIYNRNMSRKFTASEWECWCISNKRRAQNWKNTNISEWTRGAICVEDTNADVNETIRVFGERQMPVSKCCRQKHWTFPVVRNVSDPQNLPLRSPYVKS